jgi:hypothetical protein
MLAKSANKRYKPQRITNARGDGHVVKLCANQSFLLLFGSPAEYDMPDYEWHVELKSDLLKLVPSKDKPPGAYAAEIRQLHNLSAWSTLNRSFLGNAIVSLRKRNAPVCDSEPWGSLSVYLEADPDCQNKQILSVIRPSDQIVRLERDEVLEVVIPDIPQLLWRPYTFPLSSDGKFFLELVNHQYIDDCMATVTKGGFHTTHWLMPDLPDKVGEHHFWFRWSDRSRVEATSAERGVHPGSRISFIGKTYKKDVEKELQLRVYLGNKKKDKKLSLPSIETKSTLIETDITKRCLYEERRLLVNPKEIENLTFAGKLDMFTVEILVPKGKVTDKWEPTVRAVELAVDGASAYVERISVLNKDQYEINGHTFQRFQLLPKNVLDADEVNLGEVVFSLPKNLSVPSKRIACRLKKGKVITDCRTLVPYVHKASDNATASYTGSNYTGSYNNQYGNYHHNGKKKKKSLGLDYAEVQIQDVSVDQRLEVGETQFKSGYYSKYNPTYTPPSSSSKKNAAKKEQRKAKYRVLSKKARQRKKTPQTPQEKFPLLKEIVSTILKTILPFP